MKCKYLKQCVTGVIFVLITGSLSHFVYDWTGQNPIAGLFTPVNESIWEHMKLLFFPMLAYSLVIIFRCRQESPCIASGLFSGLLTGTFLIPLFYYAYTGILGKNLLVLDIAVFVMSTVIAFWLSCKLAQSCQASRCTFLLCVLVCALFICFLLFTEHAPDAAIFMDPSA